MKCICEKSFTPRKKQLGLKSQFCSRKCSREVARFQWNTGRFHYPKEKFAKNGKPITYY